MKTPFALSVRFKQRGPLFDKFDHGTNWLMNKILILRLIGHTLTVTD